ncbi:MAG TPA: ribonuclease III [Armatimonadetes bacterium]|nr:ribonuclease III [Armatimonadota bacterium]
MAITARKRSQVTNGASLTSARRRQLERLSRRLNVQLRKLTLLNTALTHPSYCAEHPKASIPSNQRLEFLGDSVLGLIIARYLYQHYPDLPEGELTRIKAAVVSEPVLAEIAKRLRLGSYLLLGKGEEQSGGRQRPSILADALEAVIAAIFLDRGLKAATNCVLSLMSRHIELIHRQRIVFDFKSRLQELVQERFHAVPVYNVVEERGPNHMKTFVIEVCVNNKRLAVGEGHSKKEAEQAAAQAALNSLLQLRKRAGTRSANR